MKPCSSKKQKSNFEPEKPRRAIVFDNMHGFFQQENGMERTPSATTAAITSICFCASFASVFRSPERPFITKIRIAPTFSYWDGSMFASLICSRIASRRCCVKRFIADAGTTPTRQQGHLRLLRQRRYRSQSFPLPCGSPPSVRMSARRASARARRFCTVERGNPMSSPIRLSDHPAK